MHMQINDKLPYALTEIHKHGFIEETPQQDCILQCSNVAVVRGHTLRPATYRIRDKNIVNLKNVEGKVRLQFCACGLRPGTVKEATPVLWKVGANTVVPLVFGCDRPAGNNTIRDGL